MSNPHRGPRTPDSVRTKTCEWCHRPYVCRFMFRVAVQRFCSDACRSQGIAADKRAAATFLCIYCDRDLPRESFHYRSTGRRESFCRDCNKARGRRVYNKQIAAERNGAIVRRPCEVCGATKTHGHHDDYTKPTAVRWLCVRHHREAHRGQPGIKPLLGATA